MTYTHICQYARAITNDSEIAKDIVHEMYLRLRKVGVNMLDDSKPKNFIWKALTQTSIDYYRKYVNPRRTFRYHQPNPFWVYCTQEDGELVAVEVSRNQVDLAISSDLLNQCRESIIKHFQITYNTIGRDARAKNAQKVSLDRFLEIFDFYAMGYTTSDIAKILKVSQPYINHYKYKLREWIQPILKG